MITPVDNNDSTGIAKLARTWRREAIAVLVSVFRDVTAPPAARASAARSLLAYSEGTPQRAEALTSTDIEDLTDEQREQVYISLTTYYLQHGFPPAVDRLMHDTIEDAAVTEELYPEVQYPQYQFPTPSPTPTKRVRRVRLNDPDDDTDILPVRRRVRLVADDHQMFTVKFDSEHNRQPARLRPMPSEGEYLIDLPHALTVNLPGNRSVQLKQGYSCVTPEVANHPVIHKFLVMDAAE